MRSSTYIIAVVTVLAATVLGIHAQADLAATYTGTVVSFGSGRSIRTTTSTFTLNISGTTSDADAKRYLAVLAEGGQYALQKELGNANLGTFSIGGRLGPRINAVRVSEVDGKKRIIAVFERWLRYAELRGGYRSVDYPFGYLEIFIDPKTGKGEGTYVAAGQIRWKRDKDSDKYHVEVENFATFPSKLMGVVERIRTK